MNIKRLLLATFAIWLFGIVYLMFTCAGLFSWVYEIPPVIWKSQADMMTTGNMIGSNLTGILGAFLFTFVYALLYKGLPGKGAKKGMFYGLIAWLIGPLAGVMGMPFYMTIANTVVIYWILGFLVCRIIMGAIVGTIYKPKK